MSPTKDDPTFLEDAITVCESVLIHHPHLTLARKAAIDFHIKM